MAFGKKTEKKAETERTFDKVESVEILRAINNKYGCFFDMRLNGVRVNDCKVMEKKAGGYFISLPSKKSGDVYYNIVMFYFSNEDQDKILQLVQDKLNEE